MRTRVRRRLRLLWILPVAAAVTAAGSGFDRGASAAEEAPDPLGYVIDLDEIDDPESIAAGRELFSTGCVSCHGVAGVGGVGGPPLEDAGAASAHFYLTSGRMPAAVQGRAQPARKPPAYNPEEIEDLVAYVASLGDGPAIPLIDPAGADLSHGGELYRLACAACHSATGAGGALSYGRNAPTLAESTPVQVAEAMLVAPGQMPRFSPEPYADEEVDAIVRYVQYLQDFGDPGGFALGRVGPIPEGFVAIVLGLGATLLAAFWIGRRHTDEEAVGET